MIRRQSGFTLVEIAVVLVIIGLLLGGVLKGQELIASARVRNLADQQSGIQAAYYGFQDRYRAIPGDMPKADAEAAIGATINTSDTAGTGNGRLEAPPSWEELNGVWEHLSKAGFLKGNFVGSTSAPTAGNTDVSPVNVFSSPVVLARHDGYLDSGTATPRLIYHFGQNVPADIARELDVKLDDGQPRTGIVRNSTESGTTDPHQSESTCAVDPGSGSFIWDVDTNPQSCNPAYLF